jgi:protein-S-isoprenylcysteine O-methyltransferase Ste14
MSFPQTVALLIKLAWVIFCVYWFVMAFSVKKAVKRQTSSSRLLHIAVGVVAYLLLFTDRLSLGVLNARFVPPERSWALAGVAVTYAGVALAIWARKILGGNWSATVTLKQDHSLVRQGPYATVRHPIYSGLLLAGLGTALAIGEVHSLLAVVIGVAGFYTKAKLEERFMIEHFGRDYEEYRQHTWALVPFVL